MSLCLSDSTSNVLTMEFKQTSATTASNYDDDLITSFIEEMKELEGQILGQLDHLGELIPDLYSGYANMVRTLVSESLSFCNHNSKFGRNLAAWGEAIARATVAYGQYKAAKEHNDRLKKYLEIKSEIARTNIMKVKTASEHALRMKERARLFFEKSGYTRYDLTDVPAEKIRRLAELSLRYLNLYRTALFLHKICGYLDEEYRAWLNNSQTSGHRRPDYFQINMEILLTYIGDKPIDVLETVMDGKGEMNGFQLTLMADPQLLMSTLHTDLYQFNLTVASPTVKHLAKINPAFSLYDECVSEYKEHMYETPGNFITIASVIAAVIIPLIIFGFMDGSTVWKLVLTATGLSAVYKIWSSGQKKTYKEYFLTTAKIKQGVWSKLKTHCGHVEEINMDYSQKSAIWEAAKAYIRG